MVMPRVNGDDGFVKAGEAPLVLGDQDRLKAAVLVARDLDSRRAFSGLHDLGTPAVELVRPSLGLGSAGRVAQMWTSFAPMARSISAFLRAMKAALTASPVIGPMTNRSISSSGIFASAALLVTMAAFLILVLLSRNDTIGHDYASNTEFRTGSAR